MNKNLIVTYADDNEGEELAIRTTNIHGTVVVQVGPVKMPVPVAELTDMLKEINKFLDANPSSESLAVE